MREYKEDRTLTQVVCNACRKNLLVENGILKEECIHVDHDFGFFGEKDGESDSFDLCEACYEKLTAGFAVPVERRERKELL